MITVCRLSCIRRTKPFPIDSGHLTRMFSRRKVKEKIDWDRMMNELQMKEDPGKHTKEFPRCLPLILLGPKTWTPKYCDFYHNYFGQILCEFRSTPPPNPNFRLGLQKPLFRFFFFSFPFFCVSRVTGFFMSASNCHLHDARLASWRRQYTTAEDR